MATAINAFGSSDPLLPDPAAGAAPRHPGACGDPVSTNAAHVLWSAFRLAGGGQTPRTLANVQDAVFRFYLPRCRTIAQQSAQWIWNPTATEQAAELGLARAVLAWQDQINDGFMLFAQAAIRDHIRKLRQE